MGRQLAKVGSTDAASESRKVTYRLGLYNPLDESEPVRLMDGEFQDTPAGRRDMESAIYHYNRWSESQSDVVHCLGVFAAENSHALT
jgi:hypothetical protein